MPRLFVTSDHHFGHKNILKFTDDRGTPIRPEFKDLEHMHEHLIERWNSVVRNNDHVVHLGDIGGDSKLLDTILPRLNGKKTLILGNHDKLQVNYYKKHFMRIRGSLQYNTENMGMLLTHIPVIKTSFNEKHDGRCVNVHGHTHQRDVPDPLYVNVCVEKTNYTPIFIDDLWSIIKKRIDLSQSSFQIT